MLIAIDKLLILWDNFSMKKIINVYCVLYNGTIAPFSFDGDNFTTDTAEKSMRDKGMTVVYSTQNVLA